jgi:hypothetical protein
MSPGASVAGATDVSVFPVTGTDSVGRFVTTTFVGTAAGAIGVLVVQACSAMASIKTTPKIKVLLIFSLL